MWIKNASILGLVKGAKFDFSVLQNHQFQPVSSHDLMSSGWSDVHEGALFFSYGGQHLLHFTIEKKVIPASAVAARLKARRVAAEKNTGFAPGKKAIKEMKESIIDEMLPTAFATRSTTKVWIDTLARRIIIDTSSKPVIEAVQSLLLKTFEGIGLEDVKWPGSPLLGAWLCGGEVGYTVDDEVHLQWPGERGKTAKFARANLQDKDIMHGVSNGAQVTALAMTYNDRISFIMTDSMQIRRIKPLDIITTAETPDDVDAFLNDFTLMTAELGILINSLQESV